MSSKRISEIKDAFNALGDAQCAKILQKFFKTGQGQYGCGDIFLGIKVPVIRAQAKRYRDTGINDIIELLGSPCHEHRMLALFLLIDKYRGTTTDQERKAIYELYLQNTDRINNWDLVDCSAEHIVGCYLFDKSRQPLYELANSAVLWQRRISMLATFHFIKRNDFADTLKIAAILLNDKEELIHKAAGWMLREIGKRDTEAEECFLRQHCKQMPRTMLRYAIEKFPQEKRLTYLKNRI